MLADDGVLPDRFHLWRPSLGIWTKVKSHHCIQVDEQKHVFIKAMSVTRCLNFDTLIKASLQAVPHFRLNLAQERASIKARLNDRTIAHAPPPRTKKSSSKRPHPSPSPTHSPRHRHPPPRPLLTRLSPRFTASPSPSFERSLAITESTSRPIKLESVSRPIKLEPGLEIPNHWQRSGSVISLHDSGSDMEPEISTTTKIHDHIYISDTDPTPPRLPVKSRTQAFATSHRDSDATPPPGIIPSHRQGTSPPHRRQDKGKRRATTADLEDRPSSKVDGRLKEWPGDFHICDIVDGFAKCQKPPRGSTVAVIFEDYFGVKWKKSTYYDNLKHWRLADATAKLRAYDAGRVRNALWSRFTVDNPTKDVELKAARKRIRSLKADVGKGRQESQESMSDGEESSEGSDSGDENFSSET